MSRLPYVSYQERLHRRRRVFRRIASFILWTFSLVTITFLLASLNPAEAGWEEEWKHPPPEIVDRDDTAFALIRMEGTVYVCAIHMNRNIRGQQVGDCANFGLLISGETRAANEDSPVPVEFERDAYAIFVIEREDRPDLNSICGLHDSPNDQGVLVGSCLPLLVLAGVQPVDAEVQREEDLYPAPGESNEMGTSI